MVCRFGSDDELEGERMTVKKGGDGSDEAMMTMN